MPCRLGQRGLVLVCPEERAADVIVPGAEVVLLSTAIMSGMSRPYLAALVSSARRSGRLALVVATHPVKAPTRGRPVSLMAGGSGITSNSNDQPFADGIAGHRMRGRLWRGGSVVYTSLPTFWPRPVSHGCETRM